ncbi:hypothetical protein EYF80_063502 [Liparis tanakae]|uniref:Uncharacterized protein n=1 Tax=Liparis tanakae TaxID=230148 RepID=A0A4Z2ECS7_9TELE|nr:hypothetical protein EYF80_063502 [Liparis tanakae]
MTAEEGGEDARRRGEDMRRRGEDVRRRGEDVRREETKGGIVMRSMTHGRNGRNKPRVTREPPR